MTSEVVIQRLIYELDFEEEKPAWALQDEIVRLNESVTITLLKKIISGLPDFDGVLKIDRLELDLGELSLDRFRQEFRQAVEKALRQKLRAMMQRNVQQQAEVVSKPKGQRNTLSFMLKTGRFPWWEARETHKNLQVLVREAMEQSPDKMRQFLARFSKNEQALQRLALQLDEPTFAQLLRLLAREKGAELAVWYRKVLEMNARGKVSSAGGFRTRWRMAVLGFLLSGNAGQFSIGEAKKNIIQQLKDAPSSSKEEVRFLERVARLPTSAYVEPGHWHRTEIDLLLHFLVKGYAPSWGILERHESVAELAAWVLKEQPAALYARLAKLPPDSPLWERVLLQMPLAVFADFLLLFEKDELAKFFRATLLEKYASDASVSDNFKALEQALSGASDKRPLPAQSGEETTLGWPETVMAQPPHWSEWPFLEAALPWLDFLIQNGTPYQLEQWDKFVVGMQNNKKAWAEIQEKPALVQSLWEKYLAEHPAADNERDIWEAFVYKNKKTIGLWQDYVSAQLGPEGQGIWRAFKEAHPGAEELATWDAFLKTTSNKPLQQQWEAFQKNLPPDDDFERWAAFVKQGGNPWWLGAREKAEMVALTERLMQEQPNRVGRLLAQHPGSIEAAIEGQEQRLLPELLRIVSPQWASALTVLMELTRAAAPHLSINETLVIKLQTQLLKTALKSTAPGTTLEEIARRWVLVLSKATGGTLHPIATILLRTVKGAQLGRPGTPQLVRMALQETARNVAEQPSVLAEMGALPDDDLAHYNLLRAWLKGDKTAQQDGRPLMLGLPQVKLAMAALAEEHPTVLKSILREAFLVRGIRRRFVQLRDDDTFVAAITSLQPYKAPIFVQAAALLQQFGATMGFAGGNLDLAMREEILRLAAYNGQPRHLVTFFLERFHKASASKRSIAPERVVYKLWQFAVKAKGPGGRALRSAVARHHQLSALSPAQKERYWAIETAILLEKPLLAVWGIRGRPLLLLLTEAIRETSVPASTVHPVEIATLILPALLQKLVSQKNPSPSDWLRLVSGLKQKTGKAEKDFARNVEKYLQTKTLEWNLPQRKPIKPAPPKAAKPVVEDATYINNAGLVILHPYFSTLFKLLEMDMKNEEHAARAVHLLQYLATGRTETPEEELVLNKILCGIPLNTPIPAGIDMTDNERERCGQIFNALRAHWPAMKNSSDDNFRGSFLIRPGKITSEQGFWVLRIPPGMFDMLMQTMSWSVSHIKYSWMPAPLSVEWG